MRRLVVARRSNKHYFENPPTGRQVVVGCMDGTSQHNEVVCESACVSDHPFLPATVTIELIVLEVMNMTWYDN